MSETSQSPNEFLKRYIGVYYSENGVARWNSTINKSVITNAHTPQESLDEIRQQLNEHKPVIISGNDGTAYGDHFVLVVGYVNDGMALSDYIVIDPYHTFDFPRTMDDFYAPNHYPNPCKQIGLTYEILVFNSRWEISEAFGQ